MISRRVELAVITEKELNPWKLNPMRIEELRRV